MSLGAPKKVPSRHGSTLPPRADCWKEIIQLGQHLTGMEASYETFVGIAAADGPVGQVVARLMQGDVALWLSEELWPSYLERCSPIVVGETRSINRSSPSTWMQGAMESRQPYVARKNERGETEEATTKSEILAMPLIGNDGMILGVMQVARSQPASFSPEDHDLLEILAGQVVMSLQSLQRAAIESWRVDQLSLVRQVSLQILNVRDLDELARRVTGLILDAFHYYFVAIFTKDPGEDLLDFRASAGPGGRVARDSAGLQFRLGEGMIGHVALAGEELVANDVSQEPRYLYLEPLPETRSEATLPLKIQDQVVGVLDVQSNLINDFHEVDLLVLRALADNIAVAVEGTRLYSRLERRADHFAAIYEISNAISSILDPEQLLSEVVYLIQKHFGYPYVHLFTVHPGRRKVIFSAGSGARSQPLEEKGFTLDLDDPQGIISWVARSGQTLLVNDVAQEARFRPPPIPPFDTKAELAVPLVYGGEVLGVLDVQSNQQKMRKDTSGTSGAKVFGEDDRFVFEALADNIAVAMRNASLYRSEVWRRQVADSLRDVAGLLSADVDLSHVLESILKELVRNLPCDVASIWLLEEGGEEYSREEDEIPGDYPALRLASLSGPLASVLNLAQGLSLEGFIHSSLVEQDQAGPESRAALLMAEEYFREVLQSKEPVIRSAFSLDDPLAVALKFPEDYSSIGAPLRIGDQSLGVLMLSHHTSGRYGQEASGITATFGSYAAVATENTRLYEAAHEQAWVSTVLLQVAEATQAITDPNDLLGAIARITPMLVGVDTCAIYTLDDDDVFIPSAVSGLDQERQTAFFQQRFEPEQVAAFDELLTERSPSLIRLDVGWTANDSPLKTLFLREDDAEDAEEYFRAEGHFRLGGWRSSKWIIVAPILGREDLLGAFLVVYSSDPAAGGLQQAFEETVSIIQGISHQLAMSMENSRLEKLQKEEAYVSVALLQVAQAVVSNNDLNDILGSIVRITPILVGIPRLAVFLWDDERQVFLLSQAYGIPKTDERLAFAAESFYALELVRQQDRLLAWPYVASNPGNILESWANLAPSPLQDIEQILESGTSLLLSFPLSVKGQVFGVFLLEEPENLFNGNSGPLRKSTSDKRRMRSKRLEIMTGITQQAALAIQNDVVQRDFVRRERLEQEMLMARQIQHTFLPHSVPEFKGWELKVYWQPAREVAGDFYDFFLLPDNRLGVVIADVADKGMPAALFMTLVRTVMRATIQQPESPAEILARVNNILVPDSEQGMFVTLFYLVLSLETGELVYSNAGHNPPLHFRYPMEEVHHLEKGGIALGVVPDSEFKNSILQLSPGEFLVLYTDGITEAFSPSEEMYGVKGLVDTIKLALIRSPDLSAQELLQGIDQSVQVFVGDSLPSDDMTLIVLHRSGLAEEYFRRVLLD